MKRIKGRYVAQVTVDFDLDARETRPLEEITADLRLGRFNRVVQGELSEVFGPLESVVDVQQMYADAYEVDMDELPGGGRMQETH